MGQDTRGKRPRQKDVVSYITGMQKLILLACRSRADSLRGGMDQNKDYEFQGTQKEAWRIKKVHMRVSALNIFRLPLLIRTFIYTWPLSPPTMYFTTGLQVFIIPKLQILIVLFYVFITKSKTHCCIFDWPHVSRIPCLFLLIHRA